MLKDIKKISVLKLMLNFYKKQFCFESIYEVGETFSVLLFDSFFFLDSLPLIRLIIAEMSSFSEIPINRLKCS